MGTSKSPYASLVTFFCLFFGLIFFFLKSLFSPKDSRVNIDTPQMSHEDLSEFRGLHDRSDFIQMSTPRRRGKSEIDMLETPRASWTDRTERQIEEIIAGAGKIIINTKTEESFSFMEQDHGEKNTHERHETSIEMEEAGVNKKKEKRERRERKEKKDEKGGEKEIEIVKEKKKKRDKEKSESSRRKKEKGEESSESPKKSKKEKSEERSEDSPPKEKKKKRHSEKKEKVEGTTEEKDKEKSKKRKSKSKNKSKSKTPEIKSGMETLRHSQLDKINEADKENEEERDTTKNNEPETEPRQLDTHEDHMNHSIHSHHSHHSNNSIHSEIILVKQKLVKGFSLRKLLATKQLSSGISDQGTPQHADLTNASLVSTGGFGTFTSLNNLIQLHPSRSDENSKLKTTESLQLADRVEKKIRKSKKEMTFKEEEKLSRKSTKEHKEHKETKDKKEKEKKSHRKKSKKSSKSSIPAVPGSSNEIVRESESLLNKPSKLETFLHNFLLYSRRSACY